MIQLIQIVGAVVVVFGGIDLFGDDEKNTKKTWSKIGGGVVLLLLGTLLKRLGVDF